MTRSASIVWLLEELGVPYATRIVDFSPRGRQRRPRPGQSASARQSARADGRDDVVFESSAIALYLTDKYRKQRMGPAAGEPKRGEYLPGLPIVRA